MKRSTTILVATAALFLLVLIFIASAKKQSELTILINGVPAANFVMLDFQTATPRTLNATGTISYPSNTNTEHAVFVPQKMAQMRSFRYLSEATSSSIFVPERPFPKPLCTIICMFAVWIRSNNST